MVDGRGGREQIKIDFLPSFLGSILFLEALFLAQSQNVFIASPRYHPPYNRLSQNFDILFTMVSFTHYCTWV